MRSYNKVSPNFWTSATVKSLSDDARLLFLYLITCPHNNIIGMFRAPLYYVMADMKWEEQRVREGLLELCTKPKPNGSTGVISWDESAELVLIHTHLKHNPLENGNQVTAALKVLDTLPTSTNLFNKLETRLKRLGKPFLEPFAEGFRNRLTNGLGNPYPNQEQEQEQEQEDANASSAPAGASVCPHKEIKNLYHQILPELRPVKIWNRDRKTWLRARWREGPERQNLDWWREYFELVRECPHLMGDNNRQWQADLEWLIRPQNMPKVLEGRYRSRKTKPGDDPYEGLDD